SQRSAGPCSLNRKFLMKPTCQTLTPGPLITPLAAEPNCPGWGAANAPASNQRFTERWSEGRLGSRDWSGRRVTLAAVRLVVWAVPVVSGPLHIGVRNCPE